jgi:Antitoxin VbhA
MISNEEKARRRKSVNLARRLAESKGLKPSQELLELAEQYINGEIEEYDMTASEQPTVRDTDDWVQNGIDAMNRAAHAEALASQFAGRGFSKPCGALNARRGLALTKPENDGWKENV